MSSLSSGADYEHMFELTPVSLWLEDFSELKQLFDGWRAQGIDPWVFLASPITASYVNGVILPVMGGPRG